MNQITEVNGVEKFDAKSYAESFFGICQKLKGKNKDFFIMLAGMDASAPSWMPGMEDEEFSRNVDILLGAFVRGSAQSDLHGGSPTPINIIYRRLGHHILILTLPSPVVRMRAGRGTIRTYEWELALLKELGVD